MPSSGAATAGAAGIVLAAGTSRRFGDESKLLATLHGEPVIRRTVRAVLEAELETVIVVLGHRAPAVIEALRGLRDPGRRLQQVVNPDFASGQSTSVRAGLAAVPPATAAAVFVPGDQPLLTAPTLRRLVETWRAGAPIVVTRHGERQGAPVLFDRHFFPELERLRGDTGGRPLLSRHRQVVQAVQVGDPRELDDVDTPADLRILQAAAP